MSTPIFTCVKRFTNVFKVQNKIVFTLVLFCGFFTTFPAAYADWSVDFSRRASKIREADLNAAGKAGEGRQPAAVKSASADGSGSADLPAQEVVKKGVFDTIFDAGEPVQDLVILHTEKGFIPSILRVRKGGRYRIHVVNVNEKEKNVSFILDGFSEHHATYYGKIKIFTLDPKKEGTYSFQSPETSSEGKLVVFNPQINLRAPSSEE